MEWHAPFTEDARLSDTDKDDDGDEDEDEDGEDEDEDKEDEDEGHCVGIEMNYDEEEYPEGQLGDNPSFCSIKIQTSL